MKHGALPSPSPVYDRPAESGFISSNSLTMRRKAPKLSNRRDGDANVADQDGQHKHIWEPCIRRKMQTSEDHSTPLVPTWHGHVASTLDALVLFESALSGRIDRIRRRPYNRERQEIIKSGSVFIYEEHATGIKRWTDGLSWSPSRILGNFLIYRELDNTFEAGGRNRAIRKKRVAGGSSGSVSMTKGASRSDNGDVLVQGRDSTKNPERSLVGSLVNSYRFKKNGLVKKTISITFRGVPHHLVSYYGVDDVLQGNLLNPFEDDSLLAVAPSIELLMSQNFRAPVNEFEHNPYGTLLSTYGIVGEFCGSDSNLERAWTDSMQPKTGSSYGAAQPWLCLYSHGEQLPYSGQISYAT